MENLRDVKTALLETSLHEAVRNNEIRTICDLISKGVNANLKDSNGDTALHLAVELKNENISKLLVDVGTDVNATNFYNKHTPLHHCVIVDNLNILKLLIGAGANLNAKDSKENTALLLAARMESFDTVKILTNAGANVNLANHYKETPLHWAVKWENEKILKLLLKAKADVNAKDQDGTSAVHLAARSGSVTILNFLLEAGADVGTKDSEGNTPLHLAIKSENESIFILLLNTGSNINSKNNDRSTPLHLAAVIKNTKILKLLIRAGAYLNCKDKNGYSPLERAAEADNTKALKLLIRAGAEIQIIPSPPDQNIVAELETAYDSKLLKNLISDKKDCPKTKLHRLAESDNSEIIHLLVSTKSEVDAKIERGDTLLHIAVKLKNESLLKLLLNGNSDVNVKNDAGLTSLHCSAQTGIVNISKLLIEYGADICAKDNNGLTAVYYALESRSICTTKCLFEAAADQFMIPSFQESLLSTTKSTKNLNFFNFLRNVEGEINHESNFGNDSLRANALWENFELVRLLLDAAIDFSIGDIDGNTPLQLVDKSNYEMDTLLSLLIKIFFNGSNVDILTKESIRIMIESFDTNYITKNGYNFFIEILKLDSSSWTKKYFYKTILEYIAKLITLGIPVHSKLMDYILNSNVYRGYFTECTEELEKAKNTKINHSWVTFFNLLTDKEYKLVKYAGNKNLIVDFARTDVDKKFPIFGRTMKSNVNNGIYARQLFDDATSVLSDHLPIFNFPCLMTWNILDALSKEDWQKLCK